MRVGVPSTMITILLLQLCYAMSLRRTSSPLRCHSDSTPASSAPLLLRSRIGGPYHPGPTIALHLFIAQVIPSESAAHIELSGISLTPPQISVSGQEKETYHPLLAIRIIRDQVLTSER